MRMLVGFLAALACAGCAGSVSQTREPAISDGALRELVLSSKGTLFKDPASIRDASIGHAFVCRDGDSCICISANARNGFGGYTGIQKHVAVWSSGQLQHMRGQDFGDQCEYLTPFAELNGDYVAPPTSPAKPTTKPPKSA
ncbi:hypothetical protein QCM77_27445 [Bradyrhizobium sp. SSUT18]|uniref:hypothetical protein n=1 Tax=Bradyrhizobium sp. SSUT18 TaxID=3040602 RepID=UPI00244D5D0E|nr:hypothetical protein [Bradyrhizobium sp. SSUT18]MDH2403661.1 hypothetical protein [Bradyrhizobium sp. SSUT18]